MFRISPTLKSLGLLAGLCAFTTASAADTVISSDARQTALLELYTSEGCSSCPPADRWYSGLASQPGLWRNFVPLAFHVDYWDYIGWKDRFASPTYSARQRQYANEGGVRVVYTPGLMLDGKEWQGWRRNRLPNRSANRPGPLSVEIVDGRTTVAFSPRNPSADNYVAYVTWLGFGLSSDVNAGENHGRTLEHDFVVLTYDRALMTRRGDELVATLELSLPPQPASRFAVAAWVADATSLTPLQATGGWVDDAQTEP